ncbi:uncharacterized protein K452DRAFT_290355 [Aplosporella prunicola CBS 121167]|uniref:Secreted protein n=1 Tax=Aplosporella prunicola CBS 121167 TaxID=1176127 RepID=A0A6A6B3C4_9PEZI|nr:uncharacterized protein K452DRAFT_290355 [Aplosporella prunicola CBS 121167]KAF2138699.1 hypothetical protein K452DRAFT_290355 [Aplosporella prunicola CBS 121167]
MHAAFDSYLVLHTFLLADIGTSQSHCNLQDRVYTQPVLALFEVLHEGALWLNTIRLSGCISIPTSSPMLTACSLSFKYL